MSCDHDKFGNGKTTQHQTFGISSGLQMTPSYETFYPKPKHKLDLNKYDLCIVDIEGLYGTGNDQMMPLLKHRIFINSSIKLWWIQ